MIDRRGLPIADAPLLGEPARRERLLRTGLTGTLALLLAAAIVLAARARDSVLAAPAPAGRVTEVVLDVSGSVGGSSYGVVADALERLGHGHRPVGLVLFSDSAEEALPPGTPPAQLLSFVRLFSPLQRALPSETANRPPRYEPNPWYPSFSGGTRISAGLAAAREALMRDGVRGDILLITDLGDAPDDRNATRRELVSLARAGIDMHVLALPNAYRSDLNRFGKLVGPGAMRAELPRAPAAQAAARGGSSFPVWLAIAAALLALALAANERFGVSLRWRAAA